MTPNRIWLEQGAAARGIEADFGTDNALADLVGETFRSFLEAAESDETFRSEMPAIMATSLHWKWPALEILIQAV